MIKLGKHCGNNPAKEVRERESFKYNMTKGVERLELGCTGHLYPHTYY